MGKPAPPPLPPTQTFSTFKYGMPIYGIAWPEGGQVFFVCGGGGSTNSGIKNRLVAAECRSAGLTDQLEEYSFGGDCPMRMAMNPNGRSIVFAMGQGGIKRLDVDTNGPKPRILEITGSLQERLAAIRVAVKCLAFDVHGDHLALGGEDGSVYVYEWPGLKLKLELSGDKGFGEPIKDLDFSEVGAAAGLSGQHASSSSSSSSAAPAGATGRASSILAVVLDNGSLQLWDWRRATLACKIERPKTAPGRMRADKLLLVSRDVETVTQHLPKGMDMATFARVRYARDGSGRLFALMCNRYGGHVTVWTPGPSGMPTLRGHLHASKQPGGCFDVSRDCTKVAIGTSEGGIVVASTLPLAVLNHAAKSHMVFTTAITFSPSGLYVVSASADASATVLDTRKPAVPKRRKRGPQKPFLFAFIIFAMVIITSIMTMAALKMFYCIDVPLLIIHKVRVVFPDFLKDTIA